MTDVLYLTHNGITDHIGQSQVAPYKLGLAERGYRVHIVSVEKPGRERLMERYRQRFAEAGIDWSWVPYHNRPQVAAQFYDLIQMRHLALRIAREERPRLVHSRSWIPLEIAKAVKQDVGARFLLDFRHFFIEAGIKDSRFPWVYRLLAMRERGLFHAADHVVTLTRKAAQILDRRYPHPAGLDRYTIIPCCADFDHFDLARTDPERVSALRRRLGIPEASTVLLYLGSLGPDYLLHEMLLLFRELRAVRPDARFLFVCNNGRDDVFREAQALNIPADAIVFTQSPRNGVPDHLALTDLSVLFYRPDLSRAGCSPTKMAELFATNVPVIANSNVGDLDEILSPERNCSLCVPDFRPETLRAAVERMLEIGGERGHIRQRSAEFRLEAGVASYAGIYERLIGAPASVSGNERAV